MIGLAVGRLASTLALRPLAELTRVADAVARGKLDARLQAERDRDLGGLARSFNQTAAALGNGGSRRMRGSPGTSAMSCVRR